MGKYGLIGGKLGHSFSIDIHESCYDILGENSTYKLIETPPEKLCEAIQKLRSEEYNGINVTIPHKVAVMEYADEISPEAKSIGAVNTLKFSNGKIYAYNTDYYGMKKTFEKFDVSISNKDVYILGTGGAANAVSALCNVLGGKVKFVSRTPSDTAIGYDEFNSIRKEGVLINCTPVGMYPNVNYTPTECVAGIETVVDLIYNPYKTKLLELAEDKGIKVVNGLYMLVAQAVYAEAIWHCTELDEKIIDEIYYKMEGDD